MTRFKLPSVVYTSYRAAALEGSGGSRHVLQPLQGVQHSATLPKPDCPNGGENENLCFQANVCSLCSAFLLSVCDTHRLLDYWLLRGTQVPVVVCPLCIQLVFVVYLQLFRSWYKFGVQPDV